MIRFARFLASFALVLLMTSAGWCQTDSEGRALAWQLYEAYEAGGSAGQFEAVFTRDAQLTKRAFVSTMEYATEIYQSDMNAAGDAITFANTLAGLIGQRFGDPLPSSLMQRLMRQDVSAMAEFVSYATALYPGYATGPAAAYGPGGQYGPTGPGANGPGGQYGPTGPGGYGPGGQYGPTGPGAYGPGGQYSPTGPGAYGPDGQYGPTGPGANGPGGQYGPTGPGTYGPGNNSPGAYSDDDYEDDGAYSPDQQPSAPPSTGPWGPSTNAQPGFNPAGLFRPPDATGGPAKEK
jgi:hypothetical protein